MIDKHEKIRQYIKDVTINKQPSSLSKEEKELSLLCENIIKGSVAWEALFSKILKFDVTKGYTSVGSYKLGMCFKVISNPNNHNYSIGSLVILSNVSYSSSLIAINNVGCVGNSLQPHSLILATEEQIDSLNSMQLKAFMKHVIIL